MNNHIPFLLKPNVRLAVLLLTLLTAGFWILGSVIDVYKIPWVGAIYELLWLFSVLFVLILPVLAILGWVKEKFKLRSGYLVSILIIGLTILFLSLSGNK